jgi:tetratricopeptide (TPR) repeat protein
MTDSPATWQTLQKSADRARLGADLARAIDIYTQALAQPDITWEATCAVLMARADSYQLLGNTAGLDTDLTTLAEQAAQHGDDAARSAALANLADALRYTGDFERSLQAAEQALQSAERSGQVGLQMRALCSKSSSLTYRLEWKAAEACLNNAEAIASPSDAEQQIYLCRAKQNFEWRLGRITASRQAAEQGLRLARSAGNRAEEGRFLNTMYISTTDLAARGVYLEQALQAFEAVGARLYQNMILLNSCTWWIQVGLYGHALEAARQALLAGRAMGQDSDILYALQNLSGPLAELGDFSQSAAVAQEGLAIAQKLNDSVMEYGLLTFLATIAFYQGEPQSARRWLQQAEEHIKNLPAQFHANLLSWRSRP